MNAWGPGDVIPKYLKNSFWMSLLDSVVSNIPGVSTMSILWLKRTAELSEHPLVIDDPDTDDLKQLFPRIVFPVALFPDPVLPISIILISLSFQDSMPNLNKKQRHTLNYIHFKPMFKQKRKTIQPNSGNR